MEKVSTRLEGIISECLMTRGITVNFRKLLEILHEQVINYSKLDLK